MKQYEFIEYTKVQNVLVGIFKYIGRSVTERVNLIFYVKGSCYKDVYVKQNCYFIIVGKDAETIEKVLNNNCNITHLIAVRNFVNPTPKNDGFDKIKAKRDNIIDILKNKVKICQN